MKSKKFSTVASSHTNGTIKLEPVTSGSLVTMNHPVSTSTDTGNVSTLPMFVCTNWVNCFLPMLYHCFGSSNKPWKMFTKGDEMLLIIQEAINTVYPGNTYRVKWGDSVCTMV